MLKWIEIDKYKKTYEKNRILVEKFSLSCAKCFFKKKIKKQNLELIGIMVKQPAASQQ